MCSDIPTNHGVFDPIHKLNEKAYVVEECFLGTFLAARELQSKDGIRQYLLLVEEYHFIDVNHAAIYSALRKCYDAGKPLNLFAAKEYFPSGVAGKELLRFACGLLESAMTPYVANEYAKSIKQYWAERERSMLLADAMAGKITFDEANATIAFNFSTIKGRESSCASVFESAADLYENLDKVDESEVFETRLKSLNNILGRGLDKGNTYVVAGRPAMGKSAFATSVFLPKAGSNQGVLFFSLEMTNKDLTARILSDLAFTNKAKITYKDIKNKKVHAYDAQALVPCIESLKTIPFYIDECSEHTIVSLRAVIEEYIAKLKSDGKELACVVIDHIGLVTPDNRYSGNKTAETGAVSRALKIIAKDYNVAVVAVCQLNRGVEKQENKRPQLSDLRWSGDIEQDATAVIGVYRDAYYNAENGGYEGTPNILEAIILKNRNGECETLQFYCSMAFNHISERL